MAGGVFIDQVKEAAQDDVGYDHALIQGMVEGFGVAGRGIRAATAAGPAC